MKLLIRMLLPIFLLCIVFDASAESGPPIPKPTITIEEASKLAWEQFLAEKHGSEHIKNKDYFVISAKYKFFGDSYKILDGWTADGKNDKKYLESVKDKWVWEIEIAHSLHTDIAVIFKVDNKSKVTLLRDTQ